MMKSKELHFGPNLKLVKAAWTIIERQTTGALRRSVDHFLNETYRTWWEAKAAINDEIWSGKKMGRWTERYDWRF